MLFRSVMSSPPWLSHCLPPACFGCNRLPPLRIKVAERFSKGAPKINLLTFYEGCFFKVPFQESLARSKANAQHLDSSAVIDAHPGGNISGVMLYSLWVPSVDKGTHGRRRANFCPCFGNLQGGRLRRTGRTLIEDNAENYRNIMVQGVCALVH